MSDNSIIQCKKIKINKKFIKNGIAHRSGIKTKILLINEEFIDKYGYDSKNRNCIGGIDFDGDIMFLHSELSVFGDVMCTGSIIDGRHSGELYIKGDLICKDFYTSSFFQINGDIRIKGDFISLMSTDVKGNIDHMHGIISAENLTVHGNVTTDYKICSSNEDFKIFGEYENDGSQ